MGTPRRDKHDKAPDRLPLRSLDTDRRTQLQELNNRASAYLRNGSIPDPAEFRRNIAVVKQCVPPFSYKEEDQTVILEALRRFADIADRVGDYEGSKILLAPYIEEVRSQLACAKADTEVHTRRAAELIWCVIIYSVVEHREGNIELALQNVIALQSIADSLEPREQYLNIRCRIEYAIGRHCQSLSKPKYAPAAENHYTKSLEYCAEIARSSVRDALPYATYRAAIALIGLTRICVDRGELARGLRHLWIAKILLTGYQDKVTAAFVEFLFGCIFRQQNRLEDAIERLESALAGFKEIGHHGHQRYFLRCRHELAKAYLNQALESNNDEKFQLAARTLVQEPPPQMAFLAGGKGRVRWNEENTILEARIMFERERHRTIDGELDKDVLQRAKTQIDNSLRALKAKGVDDPDIRARGLIIKSEINMSLEDVRGIEKELMWITLKTSTVLDAADLGWAWLVIAEARLELGRTDAASLALNQFNRLSVENKFFQGRAQALREKIALRSQGSLMFPSFRGDGLPKKWAEYDRELKVWLLNEMTNRGLDSSAQAKLLGIRNVTVTRWFDILGLERPTGHAKKHTKS